MDRLLVLVRHGQSEWNLKNLFTGWKDIDLTEVGIAEARTAGRRLKAMGLGFDIGFTSTLLRAQKTMTLMLEEMALAIAAVLDSPDTVRRLAAGARSTAERLYAIEQQASRYSDLYRSLVETHA